MQGQVLDGESSPHGAETLCRMRGRSEVVVLAGKGRAAVSILLADSYRNVWDAD